jgi:trans-aconitate methyltransferase
MRARGAEMEKHWDAGLYDQSHSFVWKHGAALLELLAPQPGERILDLGCGTGHLTAQAAACGAEVVGLDASPAMVEQARRAYPALRFETGDARAFAFPEPFDAVFSNAALHWVRQPAAVIACVRAALRPGCRFVAEFGGKRNVAAIAAALEGAGRALGAEPPESPWYFPSVAEYAGLLERGGLEVTYAALFDRPTALEGEQGLRRWVEMFATALVNAVPAGRREEFLQSVEERLRPALYRGGTWYADYRRLRVVATRDQLPHSHATPGG